MIMFIVMTKFVLGQLAYIQKPKQFWKLFNLITNGTNKEKTKIFELFPKNIRLIPYRKISVYRDFAKIPYRTGMKFLIPLGPAEDLREL